MRYLRELVLPHPAMKAILEEYLQGIDAAHQRVQRIEDSSGPRQRLGNISRCGNSHARWLLVECAEHYVLPPKISKELSRRHEGQPREVLALSWKAQNRLHLRFTRLLARRLLAKLVGCPHGPQRQRPTSLASAGAVHFLAGFPGGKRGNENADHRNFDETQIGHYRWHNQQPELT
jgi:hypothetical protein